MSYQETDGANLKAPKPVMGFEISLPFIQISATNRILPGSIKSLRDLPAGDCTFANTNNGQQVKLYFRVAAGEKSVDDFHPQYVQLKIAQRVLRGIINNGLLTDSPAMDVVSIESDERIEELTNLKILGGLGIDESEFSRENLRWALTEGTVMADNLVAQLSSRHHPHPSHADLIGHHMRPGDEAGTLCLVGPNDHRVRGEMFFELDSRPKNNMASAAAQARKWLIARMEKDMADKPGLKEVASHFGMDIEAMKREAKEAEAMSAEGGDSDQGKVRIDFMRNNRNFSALLDLSSLGKEVDTWLDKSAIADEINQAISGGLNELINFFGVQ